MATWYVARCEPRFRTALPRPTCSTFQRALSTSNLCLKRPGWHETSYHVVVPFNVLCLEHLVSHRHLFQPLSFLNQEAKRCACRPPVTQSAFCACKEYPRCLRGAPGAFWMAKLRTADAPACILHSAAERVCRIVLMGSKRSVFHMPKRRSLSAAALGSDWSSSFTPLTAQTITWHLLQ